MSLITDAIMTLSYLSAGYFHLIFKALTAKT